MALKAIETNEFEKEVLQADGKVVVQFSQTTCMPCKVVEAQLANLVETKGLNIVKVNVDVEPKLGAEFSIMGTPTLFVFENGEVVSKHAGAGHSMQLVGELSE